MLESEGAPEGNHNRRRRTLYDYTVAVGSLSGALVALAAFASLASDKLPFAMKEDVQALGGRVSNIEGALSGLQLNQLQSLELQLIDRVQRLGDAIQTMQPGSPIIVEARRDQAEAQQRLNSVRAEILDLQTRGVRR